MSAWELYDMHCHLDLMANAAEVAAEAERLGLAIFANTVTPGGQRAARRLLGAAPNVRLGVGLHPWWVADGRVTREDVDLAVEQVREARFVGEVGLDFSPAHAAPKSFARQRTAFERMMRACADTDLPEGRRVVSIHAVRSAGVALDVLEQTDAILDCACVFHWFSGSGDELHRAVRAGCWFSVNEMMLRTRRGREYARQVPEGRLLLETDLPPAAGEPFSAGEVVASLERTLATLEELRGRALRKVVAANSAELLGL